MSGKNNHMFGVIGENHHLFGKSHSAESKVLMSKIQRSLNRTGENNPRGMLGKIHSVETLVKISEAKGTTIFVYDINGTLVNTFSSVNLAVKYFDSSYPTIIKYVQNNKLFKNKWYLSNSKEFLASSSKSSSNYD